MVAKRDSISGNLQSLQNGLILAYKAYRKFHLPLIHLFCITFYSGFRALQLHWSGFDHLSVNVNMCVMKLNCQEVALKPSESPMFFGWDLFPSIRARHGNVKLRLFETKRKKLLSSCCIRTACGVSLRSTIGWISRRLCIYTHKSPYL